MQDVLELFSRPTAAWFRHTFGEPTQVQKEAWKEIAAGKPVLVSAPTGTGKTLSAFLFFIDRLMEQAACGQLEEGLQVVYISPLKSLAADIRENLRRPLEGIPAYGEGQKAASEIQKRADVPDKKVRKAGKKAPCTEISVAIRTGDTPQGDRQRMVKHPPHILITTPESLFLMLTSLSGQKVLKTAKAVVIDELHALIDTKRGAHLLFSVARLERLCGRVLQRIGLSATIEPLALAAQWLSPEEARIVAPVMQKKIEIAVVGTTPAQGRKKDPVWEELAQKVYECCQGKRSVIAFLEARRYAEKLAYYVNQIAGEDFARVHHGSLSKEQRFEAEGLLREGKLRLLCATSSMELGIDVGEIDEVLQVGCPRTVSSTMQRLGRAGHNPGRVSLMWMYPRTAPEGLFCGMTAALALQGKVEEAKPPRLCLDVLAQHLVSMAAGVTGKKAASKEAPVRSDGAGGGGRSVQDGTPENGTALAADDRAPVGLAAAYSVEDVLALAGRAWTFRDVTAETVRELLRMLAGDYEHNREIPARPRILYDRIHDLVYPDPYSRMLAVAAGGTIPDKGMYAAKTLDGVKVGELDEEFVYESYVGDRFLLGAFGWRIVGQDKDTVYVEQAAAGSARVPFWKGELKGRSLKTGLAFGKMLRMLADAGVEERLLQLEKMGLDSAAAQNAADFIGRQLAATGCLPDDRTVLAEHFCDHTGSYQLMIHSMFGRRINAPLAILLQDVMREKYHMNTGCVEEENGILIYPYGAEKMPEGILGALDLQKAQAVLEAALPQTSFFSISFRYNAARALMMGMKKNGRQPLWMQRLRSTEMLDSLIQEKGHPLMVETRRECMEDLWDLDGLLRVLSGIRAGLIRVREVYVDAPSPMSLPLQWQVEAAEMYSYVPVTPGIQKAFWEERSLLEGIRPETDELELTAKRRKLPQSAAGLHSLLMMEGDLEAGELDWSREGQEETDMRSDLFGTLEKEHKGADPAGAWTEELAEAGQALYVEPGLWIAAEQQAEYEEALAWLGGEGGVAVPESVRHILRRMLYYRGFADRERICQRYAARKERVTAALCALVQAGSVVEEDGIFIHAKLYERAQKETLKKLRREVTTQPAERYAALMAQRSRIQAGAQEQLQETIESCRGRAFPAAFWEEVLFAARVKGYRESMLDSLLAEGDYFWHFLSDGRLCFARAEDVDWDAVETDMQGVAGNAIANAQENEAARTGSDPAEPSLSAVSGCDMCLQEEERILYEQLKRRGASFLKQLSRCLENKDAQAALLGLSQKGLVYADSFVPVRQSLNREKIAKSTVRQRVNARVLAMSAGRWDLVRPCRKKKAEEWLEILFMQNMILCRETFRRPEGEMLAEEAAGMTWSDALKVLRVWEYVGRVRRGYFVSGMSGAQFIRQEDYLAVTAALASPGEELIWLNATDPACVWGKALSCPAEKRFPATPSTAVALRQGSIAAILEKKGKVLRVFEESCLRDVIVELAAAFRGRRLFAGQKRMVVSQYPKTAGDAFREAGFIREMQDYALYL